MQILIWLHRWWGVACCLLFAMWFASGIAMHFVPFPARHDARRSGGTVAIDPAGVARSPAGAVAASGLRDVARIRLIGRSDRPVYLIFGSSEVKVLGASDLADGGVDADRAALGIAVDYARLHGLDASQAAVAGSVDYDQWTVSGEFNLDRPLYRISLNDGDGTDLYVSSATGDVTLVTTRQMRLMNYVGSIAHWIYPAALRHHGKVWNRLVWWLSLIATIGAVLGIIIGLLRLRLTSRRAGSPYAGLQSWHHIFGLICAPFVLSWIFSGWLSMDDGRLFSDSAIRASPLATASPSAWDRIRFDAARLPAGLQEIEWIAFDGRIYRRERDMTGGVRLAQAVPELDEASTPRTVFQSDEIDRAVKRLGPECGPAALLGADDYYQAGISNDRPVYRTVCGGDVWFDIDGAGGEVLNRFDRSSRAYRWLFGGLHRLDFTWLRHPPWLRSALIVLLCGCGFVFSVSGVVLAWRRLRNAVVSAE